MDRDRSIAAATGALAGAGVAVLAVLVLGDPASQPQDTPLPIPGGEAAARDLMAAAAELRAAAESLQRSAPREEPELHRTETPDSVPASARLDDLAELVERLERVAAMTAKRATEQAGGDWNLPEIQASYRSMSGPRIDAIVEAARRYDDDAGFMDQWLFSSAADIFHRFGRPTDVTLSQAGLLYIGYVVNGPAGGLANGGSASLSFSLASGFVYGAEADLQ
jgi:hypothetical protein